MAGFTRLFNQAEVRAHLGNGFTAEFGDLRLELLLDGIEREIFTVVAAQAVQEPPPGAFDHRGIALAVLEEGDEYALKRICWTSSRPSPARNAMGITGSSVSTA